MAYANWQDRLAADRRRYGTDHLEFLTIDHVNGNGATHRRAMGRKDWGGVAILRWLKKAGFPKGFRVLCFNCNFAIGAYGKCPHKEGTR